jgi:hypothetical protein
MEASAPLLLPPSAPPDVEPEPLVLPEPLVPPLVPPDPEVEPELEPPEPEVEPEPDDEPLFCPESGGVEVEAQCAIHPSREQARTMRRVADAGRPRMPGRGI